MPECLFRHLPVTTEFSELTSRLLLVEAVIEWEAAVRITLVLMAALAYLRAAFLLAGRKLEPKLRITKCDSIVDAEGAL